MTAWTQWQVWLPAIVVKLLLSKLLNLYVKSFQCNHLIIHWKFIFTTLMCKCHTQHTPLGTIYKIKLSNSVMKINHGPHGLEGLLKAGKGPWKYVSFELHRNPRRERPRVFVLSCSVYSLKLLLWGTEVVAIMKMRRAWVYVSMAWLKSGSPSVVFTGL